MGIKSCPSCGATPLPEARFCRSCGAPLRVANSHESEAPVSPRAQTVPLSKDGRGTDGLATGDERRAGADTVKVEQAETGGLLKRAEQSGDGELDKETAGAIVSTAPQPQITTALSSRSAPKDALDEDGHAASRHKVAPPATAKQQQQSSASTRSRRLWQAAAIVLLCVALVAGVMAFILSRRSNSSGADNTSPISISDQKQLVGEKLAEADILLESGEFTRAITVLRSAVKLDPTSGEAHMRLGKALERVGERAEAINAYRAAAQSNPNNVAAWRALAEAQVAEKLYGDAADSYRRLIEVASDGGGGSVDDQTRLAYAENLRLSGRNDEARLAYQKITISSDEAIAREARARLVELSPPPAVANNNTDPKRAAATARQEEERAPEAVASSSPVPAPTTPTPAPTRAPVDADSYYFMAMNIVNGREPKDLNDGELAAALNYFLLAQKGTHAAAAVKFANRLGKEYDRRKKK